MGRFKLLDTFHISKRLLENQIDKSTQGRVNNRRQFMILKNVNTLSYCQNGKSLRAKERAFLTSAPMRVTDVRFNITAI